MQQNTNPNDWIDVRDDDGRLLFKWSPRLGVMELALRPRERGGTRHHTELRRVPLSVFALPATEDAAVLDTHMAAVV